VRVRAMRVRVKELYNERSILQKKHTQRGLCTYFAAARMALYYGVATISRLLKIIGLFYRISSLL